MPKLGLGLLLPQTRVAGGFTPKKISGLSLWLKANAGVTQTSTGGVYSATGKVSNCATFNGLNGGGEYNSRLYSNTFGVGVNSDFALSVWMKPRSFSSAQHIIGAPFQNGLYIGADETNLTFKLYNGNAWGITAPTVTPDTWHHYVFIRDGDLLRLYADGVYIGDTNIAGEAFNENPVLSIGGGEFNEYFFNGDIDELGVWSRYLDETEVTSLYNSGNGTDYAGSPSGAIAYWSLNEETSNFRNDASGHGHTLSQSPSPTITFTWQDQSINGNDASVYSGIPVLEQDVINGKPAVFLDGSSSLITSEFLPLINTTPITIFGVINAATDNVRYTAADARWLINVVDSGGYIFGFNFGPYDSDPITASIMVGSSYNYENTIQDSQEYGNPETSICEVTNDGSLITFFKNGISKGTLATAPYADLGSTSGSFGIGAQITPDQEGAILNARCYVAEIIIYNRAITETERQQVEAYLNAKYAVY